MSILLLMMISIIFDTIQCDAMKTKDFALRIAGTIFGIVSLLHLLRIITGVSVEIAEWSLPIWVNALGFIAAAILCVVLWWLSLKKDNN